MFTFTNISNPGCCLPEDNDLVVAPLVVLDEELGGPELVGVHGAQQHLL